MDTRRFRNSDFGPRMIRARRIGTVAVCAALMAACGAEPTPEDLVRVDNGDGSWSYPLDDTFDTETREVTGAFTWRYAGQARRSWDPRPATGSHTFAYHHEEAKTVVEQLIGTSRVDEAGRIWEIESVDESRLSLADQAGDPVDPIDRRALSSATYDEEFEEGELVTWTPFTLSWLGMDCDGGADDVHIVNDESRNPISPPDVSAPRQRTAVRVQVDLGNEQGNCSGVMLRNRWLVTAAHCLFDDNNNQIQEADINIELDWANERQEGVTYAFIGDGFNPGSSGDWKDDYALIKLDRAWANDPGDMDLSNAGNSTLKGVGSHFHVLGFPGWFTGCYTTQAFWLVHSGNNDVTGFFKQTLRWAGDGTTGMSGGPLYYCPDGADDTCDRNDTGFVVALFGGWNSVASRFVGPRASNFRAWATYLMDNL